MTVIEKRIGTIRTGVYRLAGGANATPVSIGYADRLIEDVCGIPAFASRLFGTSNPNKMLTTILIPHQYKALEKFFSKDLEESRSELMDVLVKVAETKAYIGSSKKAYKAYIYLKDLYKDSCKALLMHIGVGDFSKSSYKKKYKNLRNMVYGSNDINLVFSETDEDGDELPALYSPETLIAPEVKTSLLNIADQERVALAQIRKVESILQRPLTNEELDTLLGENDDDDEAPVDLPVMEPKRFQTLDEFWEMEAAKESSVEENSDEPAEVESDAVDNGSPLNTSSGVIECVPPSPKPAASDPQKKEDGEPVMPRADKPSAIKPEPKSTAEKQVSTVKNNRSAAKKPSVPVSPEASRPELLKAYNTLKTGPRMFVGTDESDTPSEGSSDDNGSPSGDEPEGDIGILTIDDLNAKITKDENDFEQQVTNDFHAIASEIGEIVDNKIYEDMVLGVIDTVITDDVEVLTVEKKLKDAFDCIQTDLENVMARIDCDLKGLELYVISNVIGDEKFRLIANIKYSGLPEMTGAIQFDPMWGIALRHKLAPIFEVECNEFTYEVNIMRYDVAHENPEFLNMHECDANRFSKIAGDITSKIQLILIKLDKEKYNDIRIASILSPRENYIDILFVDQSTEVRSEEFVKNLRDVLRIIQHGFSEYTKTQFSDEARLSWYLAPTEKADESPVTTYLGDVYTIMNRVKSFDNMYEYIADGLDNAIAYTCTFTPVYKDGERTLLDPSNVLARLSINGGPVMTPDGPEMEFNCVLHLYDDTDKVVLEAFDEELRWSYNAVGNLTANLKVAFNKINHDIEVRVIPTVILEPRASNELEEAEHEPTSDEEVASETPVEEKVKEKSDEPVTNNFGL